MFPAQEGHRGDQNYRGDTVKDQGRLHVSAGPLQAGPYQVDAVEDRGHRQRGDHRGRTHRAVLGIEQAQADRRHGDEHHRADAANPTARIKIARAIVSASSGELDACTTSDVASAAPMKSSACTIDSASEKSAPCFGPAKTATTNGVTVNKPMLSADDSTVCPTNLLKVRTFEPPGIVEAGQFITRVDHPGTMGRRISTTTIADAAQRQFDGVPGDGDREDRQQQRS